MAAFMMRLIRLLVVLPHGKHQTMRDAESQSLASKRLQRQIVALLQCYRKRQRFRPALLHQARISRP